MRETRVIDVDYGQYLLVEAEGEFPALSTEVAGTDQLIKPADAGGAVITTYTFSGTVEVTVDVLDEEPERVDEKLWERTEEVVLTSRFGPVLVTEFDGPVRFSPLPVREGLRYHVRVSARGLKEAEAVVGVIDFDDEPVESHLVELWPALT